MIAREETPPPTPERVIDRVSTVAAAPESEEIPSGPILDVDEVSVRFSGIVAVDRATIRVQPDEVVGLIGANGAGKSTLMSAISGFAAFDGTISFCGSDLGGLPAYQRARAGISRVFQDARLFGELTVSEVVQLAVEGEDPTEFVPSLLALPPSTKAEASKRSTSNDIIDTLGLGDWHGTYIADLSTGLRRVVELACLVAASPRLMLLDEPTCGLAQSETEQFGGLIERVRTDIGASLLIVEHDMPLIMSLSDRIYCMSAGQVVAEGPPHEIRHDPVVITSYLGTDDRSVLRSSLRESARRTPRLQAGPLSEALTSE